MTVLFSMTRQIRAAETGSRLKKRYRFQKVRLRLTDQIALVLILLTGIPRQCGPQPFRQVSLVDELLEFCHRQLASAFIEHTTIARVRLGLPPTQARIAQSMIGIKKHRDLPESVQVVTAKLCWGAALVMA